MEKKRWGKYMIWEKVAIFAMLNAYLKITYKIRFLIWPTIIILNWKFYQGKE